MRPNLQDIIQDPAAGTGGFLIAANRYIQTNNNLENLTEKQRQKLRRDTFYGMEINQDTQRLALMNLILHDLEFDSQGGGIHYGDTLSSEVKILPKATLILTNPPFGSKKGGGSPTRNDLEFPTSNKQFCFLQHIYLWLKPGGRAAVILPDNVLFENNVGSQIRADLMDKCNLHTILRLPSGIFYAQGVKTNVLFFTRGKKNQDNTKEVWIYDLRTNMPSFGKRTPLTHDHFADFMAGFGDDPWGNQASLAKRVETERFKRFDRDWITERGNNLDITWLKSENDVSEFAEPAVLVREAMGELDAALVELRAILQELGEEINV
jgi:type I restriction enzyme M protein